MAISMQEKEKTMMKKKTNPLPPPNGDLHARGACCLVNLLPVVRNRRDEGLKHRQRCSWIGDHASRRSRGKRAKVEDDIYRGPAASVTDRKFEGPGITEQLLALSGQNIELTQLLRRSLEVQEKMLGIMVRAERRVIEAMGESEKDEGEDDDADEDGEGEEDEEVENENEEEKRRRMIREGKRRAE
ncbi:hypothetical protein GGU11DRAFT_866384 [Lentinula aff. detonsa]|nr:hypothetical protein GGU11DRAFT_866384 [Lentinula aff. detonsa]